MAKSLFPLHLTAAFAVAIIARSTNSQLHEHATGSITIPSRVATNGDHISYSLRPTPSAQRVIYRRDVLPTPHSAAEAKDEQLYIKLAAFSRTLYLNLTLSSDWGSEGVLVEYVGGNGSTEIRAPLQTRCHYTGHVHSSKSEGGELGHIHKVGIGEVMEDAWTAVSICNGLHGVIATEENQLFIEPASFEGDALNTMHGYKHTITKSTRSSNPTGCRAEGSTKDKVGTGPPTNWETARNKRLVASSENYVETVVVADQSMSDYHQRKDLEAYVFTLMNIVSHLYRDASIGQYVKVVLLRVIILENSQGFSGTSSSQLLDNFCSWMSSYEESRGWGHDVAVLLTRQGICEIGGSGCNTLGIANIGSACKVGKSCNINKDRGLGTAFTIAHEIGHNLGMRHDGEQLQRLSCESQEKYIMAPSFAESTNPHIWSDCSRRQLAEFLSSPQSRCLSNRPPATAEQFTNSLLLPGSEYTPTEQCQLHLGSAASYCTGRQDECAVMWCRADNDSMCIDLLIPLATGTECNISLGGMGVCHQGKCVVYGEVTSPVEGGWGKWGEWTNCSLPCGTGIQYSDRKCDSPVPKNGGHFCKGETRRYRTCNQHECIGRGGDIRQRYCETDPPSTRHSVWKTVSLDRISHLKLDACKSHCFPLDTHLSVIYSSTLTALPNGTPCLTGHARSQGVCLSGKCKPIGCAGELGVESSRDKCGVWCGDSGSCLTVAGTFSRVDAPGGYRYYQTVTIPSGSTQISIIETTPTPSNYLALKGLQTLDFVNGDFIVFPQGTSNRTFAGNIWTYQRLQNNTESFHSNGHGPTDEGVVIYILANQEYDGITFTFNLPKTDISDLTEPVYFWNITQWGVCDSRCGRGYQVRGVVCWKLSPGGNTEEEDNEKRCSNILERPPPERECSTTCQYRWVWLDWGRCNVTCGGGYRQREVKCQWIRETSGETNVDVEDRLCPVGSRPEGMQPCQQGACQYGWRHGEWGACDVVCGEGWKEREVWCEQVGKSGAVSNTLCGEGRNKPDRLVICHTPEPCSNFQWSTSKWSECNATCNDQSEGYQFRTSSCTHRNGTQVPTQFCSWVSPPDAARTCTPVCPTPPIASCRNSQPPQFCNAVVRYNICAYYKNLCCASCSA